MRQRNKNFTKLNANTSIITITITITIIILIIIIMIMIIIVQISLIESKILNSLYLIMQEYVPIEGNRSNLVQATWAMMGLIHAGQVSLLFKNSSLHIDIVL